MVLATQPDAPEERIAFAAVAPRSKLRPFAIAGAVAALSGIVIAVGVVVFVDEEKPATVPISCSVYDSDESVRLSVEGMVEEEKAKSGCQALAAELSGSSSYWIVGTPGLPEEEPRLVCAQLGPEDESGRIIVEENPEMFASAATGICGRLAHAGWTQDESVERGPWQQEFVTEALAREAIEREEQEQREIEVAAIEEEEEAIFACQERAEAAEEAELEGIERETEERLEKATESEEFNIEEESWAEEEAAWERGEAAFEVCEE